MMSDKFMSGSWYLFFTVLGLHCFALAFSSGEWGARLRCRASGLLIVVVSLVPEHKRALGVKASAVVVPQAQLLCSTAESSQTRD